MMLVIIDQSTTLTQEADTRANHQTNLLQCLEQKLVGSNQHGFVKSKIVPGQFNFLL